MTTNSFDQALDFLPAMKTSKRGPRLLALLRTVYEALKEGREAEFRYRALIARGMTHEAAVRKVFAQTYNS